MPQSKPIEWMGDSLEQVSAFPFDVKRVIGFALRQAQNGERHVNTKPLNDHIEIVADFDGNAYRGVYTIKLKGKVYVLHCFQKKSKHGIATPRRDLALIEKRYKEARKLHEEWEKDNAQNKAQNWKR